MAKREDLCDACVCIVWRQESVKRFDRAGDADLYLAMFIGQLRHRVAVGHADHFADERSAHA